MKGPMGLRWVIILAAVAMVPACTSQSPLLYSTLWVQTAGEYRAEALETYAAATARLDEALADPSWTAALEQTAGFSDLPPAVILDIDETVLDNAPFQGQLLMEGTGFDPVLWDRWVAQEAAEGVPGALAFVREAERRGIAVFYITNRSCPDDGAGGECPQESHTIANLRRLGFPDVQPERLLLKREQPEWTSEKESRRRVVAERYRILLVIGDDLGDFLPGVNGGISPARRKELVDRYEDRWGRMWFLLPNPIYGSWERALAAPKAQHLRAF